MRHGVQAILVGVALGGLGGLAGCGGGAEVTPTERLWVSGVPTDPKVPLTAFLTMRSGDEHYLGAFFQGTLLRGSHDVFRWTPTAKNRARLEFLQDSIEVNLRLEVCEATRGFDHCLEVHGDPTGTGRYYSRKRWVVRKPGRKRDLAAGLVVPVMLELAEDDPELAAMLDAAAETSTP